MMPGAGGNGCGNSDLQGSVRVNPHSDQNQQSQLGQGQGMLDGFPLTMGQSHNCEHRSSTVDYNERGDPIDNDEVSDYEEGVDEYNNDPTSKGKNICAQWCRVKWTSSMVRLLITAVSYLTEDALIEGCAGGRRNAMNLQKMGKWRLVSKVMSERGLCVSPQQCEDKFNDLNKRYKKLNDILGKGTTCEVVEKPALLDRMDHIPEKAKDEVKKLLSSKHLFYEELCSYHNKNRLHLPHDPTLQQSLQLALRTKHDYGYDYDADHLNDHIGEDDHDAESDDVDEDDDDDDDDVDDDEDYGENCSRGAHEHAQSGDPSKRMKQGLGLGNFSLGSSQFPQDFMNGCFQLQSETPCADLLTTDPESQKTTLWWNSQSFQLQLEEKKLQIEQETLELEKERFKWQRLCKRKEREMEKIRSENERMKLENERIALNLKRMQMTRKSNS